MKTYNFFGKEIIVVTKEESEILKRIKDIGGSNVSSAKVLYQKLCKCKSLIIDGYNMIYSMQDWAESLYHDLQWVLDGKTIDDS